MEDLEFLDSESKKIQVIVFLKLWPGNLKKSSLKIFWLILKAATRVLTGTTKKEYFSPCLLLNQKSNLNSSYKFLNCQTSSYLKDVIINSAEHFAML